MNDARSRRILDRLRIDEDHGTSGSIAFNRGDGQYHPTGLRTDILWRYIWIASAENREGFVLHWNWRHRAFRPVISKRFANLIRLKAWPRMPQ